MEGVQSVQVREHRRPQVARARMADRDGRISLQQQLGGGFANEVAPTDDHGIRAFDLYAHPHEQLDDARGRAGLNSSGKPEGHQARVDRMGSVDIFDEIERQQHALHVYLTRSGLLDQDPADAVVGVQTVDEGQELLGGCAGRQPVILRFDSYLLGVPLLQLDIVS